MANVSCHGSREETRVGSVEWEVKSGEQRVNVERREHRVESGVW